MVAADGQAWFEAHNAAGATATGTKWAVADGEVGLAARGHGHVLYLFANTSAFAATVRVYDPVSRPVMTASQNFTVPANSRFSIPVVTSEARPSPAYMLAPRGYRFGAIIESLGAMLAQIVVEPAMYSERQRPGLGRRVGLARDPAALKPTQAAKAAPRRAACTRSSTTASCCMPRTISAGVTAPKPSTRPFGATLAPL